MEEILDIKKTTSEELDSKFCKHCGKKIHKDAVVCVHCGLQVEELKGQDSPNIIINNANSNTNLNTNVNSSIGVGLREKNKWVSITLCVLLGYLGGHKFYEGKILMGIVYLFTCGFFLIGVVIDLIALLGKPNPYYI